MKYLFPIFFILFCACSSKKTTLKHQIDDLIYIKGKSELLHLKNSFLSDSITIHFQQIQYDTLGRKVKETSGNLTKLKTEVIRDTIIQKDTLFISRHIETYQDITQEKKKDNYWKWLVITVCLLFIFIVIKLKI